jgi:hypothetical protein
VATVPDLPAPIVALSLAVLRRRIESALMPDLVDIRLILDRKAREERDQRRRGWQGAADGLRQAAVMSVPATTNLAVVAPGIAEALLATAFGLAAATWPGFAHQDLGPVKRRPHCLSHLCRRTTFS